MHRATPIAALGLLTILVTLPRSCAARDGDPWRAPTLSWYAERCLDGVALDPDGALADWEALRADGFDEPLISELVRTMAIPCPGTGLRSAVVGEHRRQVEAERALSAPDRIDLARNRRLFPGLRGVPPLLHGAYRFGMVSLACTLVFTATGLVLLGGLWEADRHDSYSSFGTVLGLFVALLADIPVTLALLGTTLVSAAIVESNRVQLPPLLSERPGITGRTGPSSTALRF